MATSSTDRKLYDCNPRQVITSADMEAQTEVARDLDTEDNWNLLCPYNVVVNGLDVSQASGFDFNIGAGAAIREGELLKNTSADTVTLDAGDVLPRIDSIVISGTNSATSDNASTKTVTTLTRTTVAAWTSIGTGDGSTKDWDLGQANVDPRTLRVQVNSVDSADWVFDPEEHSGNDGILFDTAPTSGYDISVTFEYESGGVEGTSSLPTRKQQLLGLSVRKGTPSASPAAPTLTAGDILLANVTVPALWVGGSTPSAPTIDNTVKAYFLNTDDAAGEYPEGGTDSPYAGAVINAVRKISQIATGSRLYIDASNDDELHLSPGWGVHEGNSWRNYNTRDQTVAALAGTGWHYVYGLPNNLSSTQLPGEAFQSLEVITQGPNNRRTPSYAVSVNVPYVYLGAVYATATTPVFKRFYTDGPWTMWEQPADLASGKYSVNLTAGVTATSHADVDVSEWVPPTARLALVEYHVRGTIGTVGNNHMLWIQSHTIATAGIPGSGNKQFPRVTDVVQPWSASVLADRRGQGIVRVEDSGGSRYVNVYITHGDTSSYTVTFDMKVLGYIDDYRTLDNNGNWQFQ